MPEIQIAKERSVLIALKTGDQSAFEWLYHQYKRPIYYNLYKLVHQHEVAEELTQDVFLKIWQLRATLDETKSFPAFLRRIAGNLAIDFYRKAAVNKKLQDELVRFASELYDPLESDLQLTENQEAIHAAMGKLPPRRKLVFELCKLEGKSYGEVAQLLGISPGTVNDHIVKATKFLRGELLKNNPDTYLLFFLAAFSF